MEEPLLARRRSSSSFIPALSQIPEELQVGTAQISPILAPTPSSIKERLIFGSPDTSPQAQFVWVDYTAPFQPSSNEAEEKHLSENSEEVCTCANLTNETHESFRQPESKIFDDSFVDNRIIGSGSSEERFLADLTRLDLDVRALSPRYIPSSAWSTGISKRVSEGELDKDSDKVCIPVSSESPSSTSSADCRRCTKKQFHRSRTAPAMTVMEERVEPNAKHASSTSRSEYSPGSVITHAFLGLVLYLAVGVAIYTWKEDEFSGSNTHNFVDAIYFCIVTLCTIGYGDITPTTPFSKLFACAFVLVGFGFIDILLSSMLNYVLDSQEALLLHAVTVGHHEKATNYLVDIKKGRMRIRMKVALAFGVVIACIGVGTFVMHFLETLGWLDSFYLACMSVTTVGYGDHAFTTLAGRLFASLWLLVSTLAVARSFLYLAEARIDRRHRFIAKLVLQKEMTVGDLVAADLDNDGCVSKSDFVVYKLKQMRKIEEKDIAEICRQFSRLDTENSGKITLSCLINLHEASLASK